MDLDKFRSLKLGEPRRLTGGLTNHEHPAVSPDGSMLAHYSGDYGSIGIVLMTIEGLFIRCLTPRQGNSTQPAWHPDGRSLAWRQQEDSSAPWKIVQCGILGALEPKVLLEHAEFSYKHPSFSPDGSQLAYFSDEGLKETFQLWIMDIASGARRQLTQGPVGRNNCHPVFSPDGKRLVYHVYEGRGGEETPEVNLYELELASGAIRALTADVNEDKHPFYVDADVISFHHRDTETRIRHLELMHLPSGERRRLSDGSKNDKHPFPFRNADGKRCLAWASKKLGEELEGEDSTYDIFSARLKSGD